MFYMANYAQTVNVIGCIKTTKTAADFDSTAMPLVLYRRHFGTIPLKVEHQAAPLDVSAAMTADKKALTVAVVNPQAEPAQLKLNLASIGIKGKAQTWSIAGNDPLAYNQPGEPRKVDIVEGSPTDLSGAVTVRPMSITLWKAAVQ